MAALSLLASLGGCGRPAGLPRVAPTAVVPVAGYEGAGPDLSGLDLAPLRGRRILLDPGHGGRFRGALGPTGLAEAEVNLGVALYLRGLLEWAGAEVYLTRSADVDLSTPVDSTLAGDLARRVALADSLRPDVLVSIHHNSNATRDPVQNETQTYYPAGREGADLDLARAVHKHLVRALGISPARIMAGGFFVLRNAPVPAVLGEPAMLSNPVIEGRLSLARSHEIEARAYFRGLLEYFAGGTPQWVTVVPDTLDLRRHELPMLSAERRLGQILSWTFDPGRPGDPRLDPASVELTADGEPATWTLDASGTVVSLPLPVDLPHDVSLRARNLAGRSTAIIHHTLVARASGGPLRSAIIHDGPDLDHGPALLIYESERADLADRAPLWLISGSLPVAERIRLPVFPGRRGWRLVPPERFRGDDATILERRTGTDALAESHHRVGDLGRYKLQSSHWRALALAPGVWTDRNAPGAGWRLRWPAVPDSIVLQEQVRGFIVDPRAPMVPDNPRQALWLEADGALPLFTDPAGRTPWQDPQAAPPETLTWEPLLPALIGKRVVIDPRGGGTDEQGRSQLGTRGSDLNAQVAQRLAALLRGAGCEVALTRTAESWTPDEAKVQRANDDGADLYLALARGEAAGRITARHHPGSQVGGALAQALARVADADVAEDTQYVLRHTACPAVVVELPPVAGDEEEQADARVQDAAARALLLAVASAWQGPAVEREAVAMSDVVGAIAAAGRLDPSRLDWARWDGNFTWLPPRGRDVPLPAAGARHTLELHAGSRWQLWAVTRTEAGWSAVRLLADDG